MADRQAVPLSLIQAIAAEALLSEPGCSTLARRALRGGDHALDAAIDLAIKVREQAQIDALERKERRR